MPANRKEMSMRTIVIREDALQALKDRAILPFQKQKEAGDREALFLVLCSVCSRMKDKNNNWVSIDAVTLDDANVRISHGICPECTHILYPGLANLS